MSKRNIIRAWKDPKYRNSLIETQKALLPANPAGIVEIPDEELNNVSGGRERAPYTTICSYVCTITCTCNAFCSWLYGGDPGCIG